MRVARVQGVPVTSNLGHEAEADRSLQKAEALLRSVLTARPADRMAILRSAQIAHDRMILAGDRGASEDESGIRPDIGQVAAKVREHRKVDPLEAEESCDHVHERRNSVSWWQDGTTRGSGSLGAPSMWHDLPVIVKQAGSALISIARHTARKGDLDRALQTIRESVRMLEPPAQAINRGRTTSFVNALSREGQILGEDNAISLGRSEEAVAPWTEPSRWPKILLVKTPTMPTAGAWRPPSELCLPISCVTWTPSVRWTSTIVTLSDLAEIHNNTRARLQEVRASGRSRPIHFAVLGVPPRSSCGWMALLNA